MQSSFVSRFLRSAAPLAATVLVPSFLSAQSGDAAKPAVAPMNVSGVLFGNFQYRGDQGSAKGTNKFELERAYLTFRAGVSEDLSVRITADVFQQTSTTNNADAYYKGWTVRAKYAYLQYDFLKGSDFSAWARAGMQQTLIIDTEEGFWPRWVSSVAVDRAGYMSSSDLGVSAGLQLPSKTGELFAGIVNGPGYSSRETDRFKDYEFRLTLTPFASQKDMPLKGLTIAPWFYKGTTGSQFVNGGTGQVGTVGSGMQRDRYGVFVGIKDPRLTLGFDYAQRKDESESGANTLASPRVVTDATGRLVAGFAILRPFQLFDAESKIPLGLIARYDQVKPNTSVDASYKVVIGGLTWDLSKKAAISLDYQEQTPSNGSTVAATKTYYLHWVANF